MYTASVLILALAPDPTPSAFDVSDAELVNGDQSAHLVLYDDMGEVSAELVIWADSNGRLHVDAGFADGLYLSARIGGEWVEVESDDAAEVAARVAEIDDYLEENEPQAGWGACVVSTTGAVLSCASASWWCPIAGGAAACSCLPLLVEEWEGEQCFGVW